MGGWGWHGDKRGRVTSDEEGLGEVGGVDVEAIRVTADMPPMDNQRNAW